MKSKYVWSPEDVQSGMIVCRAHRGRGKWKPDGWTAKWTHKIGFVSGDGETTKDPATNRYVTSHYCQIAMSDGMVYHREKSREQMAADLTSEDMIPMPYSWWLQMVRYLRSQTQPDAKARAFHEAHT
jgi:hypothetical protein